MTQTSEQAILVVCSKVLPAAKMLLKLSAKPLRCLKLTCYAVERMTYGMLACNSDGILQQVHDVGL